MDAKELRIGNLVKDGIILYEVFSIERNAIHVVEYPFRLEGGQKIIKKFPSDLKPIPLTKEWFSMFGFDVDEWDNENEYVDWWSSWIEKDGKIEPKPYYFADAFELKDGLKYVHQLQNICFALTEEELSLSAWSRGS